MLNHIRFVSDHNINVEENVFFLSKRELKKAMRDTLIIWILIDNGQLAKQIARLHIGGQLQ